MGKTNFFSTRSKKVYSHIDETERLVDFLICGTQKGGTTPLYSYLKDHPDICMANRKEVHFFDNEKDFSNNKFDYSAYHSFFDSLQPNKVLGEATPIYMYWYDAPRRIWQYNPDMKLIVILRNPIDRAYSHWNMERDRGADNLSFWDAIQSERERCREALPYQHRIYSYVDRGFYMEQLRRLWTYFPQGQVLVIRIENLRNQLQKTLDVVCEFLGINPYQVIKNKNVHSRPYVSPMSAREKEFLRSIFEFEIHGIERILGWDCSDWLTGK